MYSRDTPSAADRTARNHEPPGTCSDHETQPAERIADAPVERTTTAPGKRRFTLLPPDQRPNLYGGPLLHAVVLVRGLPGQERAVWRISFDYFVFKTSGNREVNASAALAPGSGLRKREPHHTRQANDKSQTPSGGQRSLRSSFQ